MAKGQAARAMRLASSKGISLKAAWRQVKSGRSTRRVKRATRKAARSTRRASRRSASPKRSYSHRATSKLSNTSIKQGFELFLAGRGLYRGVQAARANANFYSSNPAGQVAGALGITKSGSGFALDRHALGTVVTPVLNGAMDAAYVNRLGASGLTAPGVKTFLNTRPMKPGGIRNLFKMNLGTAVDAAPSAAGWLKSGAALIEGTPVITLDSGGFTFNKGAAIDKYVAAPVGGLGSKVVHAVRTSGIVPAPLKRVFSIHA